MKNIILVLLVMSVLCLGCSSTGDKQSDIGTDTLSIIMSKLDQIISKQEELNARLDNTNARLDNLSLQRSEK